MEKSMGVYIISFYLNLRINAVCCAYTRNIPNCFYRGQPRHIYFVNIKKYVMRQVYV